MVQLACHISDGACGTIGVSDAYACDDVRQSVFLMVTLCCTSRLCYQVMKHRYME